MIGDEVYDFIYGRLANHHKWSLALKEASFKFFLDEDDVTSLYRKQRGRVEYRKRHNGVEFHDKFCKMCGIQIYCHRRSFCEKCSLIDVARRRKERYKKYNEAHKEYRREYARKNSYKWKKPKKALKPEEMTEEQKAAMLKKFVLSVYPDYYKLKPLERHEYELFKCPCCGKFFEAVNDRQQYCSYACKQKSKNERRNADPIRKASHEESVRKYYSIPKNLERRRKSASYRFMSMSLEERNKYNENRRKRFWKDGHKRLNEPDLPNNKVYLHTFPNGKVYVGITKNTELRWDNGEGYIDNPPMYEDIVKYGWDNIKHEVIADGLLRNAAIKLETQYIFMYDSTNPIRGYNRTLCSKVV